MPKIVENLGQYAKKGAVPWNKGKTGIYSADTLRRMSEAKKKKPTNYWSGKKRPDMTADKHPMWGVVREDMRGENNPNWNGGSSKDNKSRWSDGKYAHWRKAVFNRDGYVCQKCGSGGYLEAHHIKPWSTHEESRYEISNGITYCLECHADIDEGRMI